MKDQLRPREQAMHTFQSVIVGLSETLGASGDTNTSPVLSRLEAPTNNELATKSHHLIPFDFTNSKCFFKSSPSSGTFTTNIVQEPRFGCKVSREQISVRSFIIAFPNSLRSSNGSLPNIAINLFFSF